MRKLLILKHIINTSFGGLIKHIILKPKSKIIILIIEQENINMLLLFLKKFSLFNYKILMDIVAVDYPTRNKRFELIYTLLSVRFNNRLLIKTHLADKQLITSVTSLFKSAS